MDFTIKLRWRSSDGWNRWEATISETAEVFGVGDTVQEAVKDLFNMAEDVRAEFTADLNNGVLGEHLKCELDTLNELLGE